MIVDYRTVPLPQNWNDFLSVPFNKQDLALLLSNEPIAYFDPFVRGMLVAPGTQAITVPFHMVRKALRTRSTVIVTIVSGYKIVCVIS